jgi:hypothetical protein
MNRVDVAPCALALLGGLVAPRAHASPAEDPPRLKVDVERAAEDVVALHAADDLPRFEERIEVHTYQEALEALLRGAELGCGSTERGAPTRYEINPYRGSRIPVHADFLPAAKMLYSRLFSSKEPRFFLYSVRRDAEPGAALPETIDFVVREGRLPEADLLSPGGGRFELVAGFRKRAQALAALWRLERGVRSLARAREHDPPPPWFATPCPVPGFR